MAGSARARCETCTGRSSVEPAPAAGDVAVARDRGAGCQDARSRAATVGRPATMRSRRRRARTGAGDEGERAGAKRGRASPSRRARRPSAAVVTGCVCGTARSRSSRPAGSAGAGAARSAHAASRCTARRARTRRSGAMCRVARSRAWPASTPSANAATASSDRCWAFTRRRLARERSASRRPGSAGRRPGRAVGQRLAQQHPAAVDARADGADLDAERGGDLLVGQLLEVAQHDGDAEVRRQRVERGLDLGVEVHLVVGLLRARRRCRPAGRRRPRAARRSGCAGGAGPCRGTGWW